MESLLAKIESKIWPEHTDFIVEIWFLSVTEYDGRTRYYSFTIHRGSVDGCWILLPLFSLISLRVYTTIYVREAASGKSLSQL